MRVFGRLCPWCCSVFVERLSEKRESSDWGWLHSHKTPSGPKEQPEQGRAPFLRTHSSSVLQWILGFLLGRQVSLWYLGPRGEEHGSQTGRTWAFIPWSAAGPRTIWAKAWRSVVYRKSSAVSWGEHQALTSCEQGPDSRPCKPQSSHLLKGLNPTGLLAVPWALHIVPGLVFKMEVEVVDWLFFCFDTVSAIKTLLSTWL